MKESKAFTGLAAALVVLGLGASSTVLAQTEVPLDVTVSYADLNLENEEGALALYSRLQSASRKACGTTASEILGTIGQLSFNQCYRDALAEAVAKIDNEHLTRIHSG